MSTNLTDRDGVSLVDNAGNILVGETPNQMYSARTVLTSAQVKALRATPATLVAAPGAGKINIVDSVFFYLTYGSNVFTESSDNLVVEYGDSGVDITGAIETTGSWLVASANAFGAAVPAAILTGAAATAGVNETIQLTNTGDGEIAGNAGNDNTVTVVVNYHTIEL